MFWWCGEAVASTQGGRFSAHSALWKIILMLWLSLWLLDVLWVFVMLLWYFYCVFLKALFLFVCCLELAGHWGEEEAVLGRDLTVGKTLGCHRLLKAWDVTKRFLSGLGQTITYLFRGVWSKSFHISVKGWRPWREMSSGRQRWCLLSRSDWCSHALVRSLGATWLVVMCPTVTVSSLLPVQLNVRTLMSKKCDPVLRLRLN